MPRLSTSPPATAAAPASTSKRHSYAPRGSNLRQSWEKVPAALPLPDRASFPALTAVKYLLYV